VNDTEVITLKKILSVYGKPSSFGHQKAKKRLRQRQRILLCEEFGYNWGGEKK
jgi:hypothetical protein